MEPLKPQELLKQLREATSAGMADCNAALKEASYDLQAAIDIVKARGLANTSRNAGKVASEGRLVVHHTNPKLATMVEINSQTDFVSNSEGFIAFCNEAETALGETDLANFNGDLSTLSVSKDLSLEDARKEVMASTKENIVVRRWMREEVFGDNRMVFSYLHSNNKLGVMVSLEAPAKKDLESTEFVEFGNNVAMQIAAMAPIAVSVDKIPQEEKERQKTIFETQLREANKAEAQWPKIIEGKFRKWGTEVALLEQESVITVKTSIKALADALSITLCGDAGKVQVINFIRCQVGEGIEKVQEDYGTEISKLTGLDTETPKLGKMREIN